MGFLGRARIRFGFAIEFVLRDCKVPKMKMNLGQWLSLLTMLILTGCATTPHGPLDWTAWQARRTESIGGTNGWTTLIGLHWLKEGPSSAGGDPTNHVVIASVRAPADLGTFTRAGTSVWFEAHADVRVNGQKVTKLELISDESPKPTKLQVGSLSIIAIKRGERMGLRVRDSESKERSRVSELRWFPYDPAWRFEGRFEPFELSKRLHTPDVTGATQEFVSPGAIVFTAQGKEYRLDVALEPDEPDYFIMSTIPPGSRPMGRAGFSTWPNLTRKGGWSQWRRT